MCWAWGVCSGRVSSQSLSERSWLRYGTGRRYFPTIFRSLQVRAGEWIFLQEDDAGLEETFHLGLGLTEQLPDPDLSSLLPRTWSNVVRISSFSNHSEKSLLFRQNLSACRHHRHSRRREKWSFQEFSWKGGLPRWKSSRHLFLVIESASCWRRFSLPNVKKTRAHFFMLIRKVFFRWCGGSDEVHIFLLMKNKYRVVLMSPC